MKLQADRETLNEQNSNLTGEVAQLKEEVQMTVRKYRSLQQAQKKEKVPRQNCILMKRVAELDCHRTQYVHSQEGLMLQASLHDVMFELEKEKSQKENLKRLHQSSQNEFQRRQSCWGEKTKLSKLRQDGEALNSNLNSVVAQLKEEVQMTERR